MVKFWWKPLSSVFLPMVFQGVHVGICMNMDTHIYTQRGEKVRLFYLIKYSNLILGALLSWLPLIWCPVSKTILWWLGFQIMNLEYKLRMPTLHSFIRNMNLNARRNFKKFQEQCLLALQGLPNQGSSSWPCVELCCCHEALALVPMWLTSDI